MTTITITYTTSSDNEFNDLPLPDNEDTYFSVNNDPVSANGNGFNKITGNLVSDTNSSLQWATDDPAFKGALVGEFGDSSVSLSSVYYADTAVIYFCTVQPTLAAITLILETINTCGEISVVYQYKTSEGQEPAPFNPGLNAQNIGMGWKVGRRTISGPVELFLSGLLRYLPKITLQISAGAFTSIGFRENPTIGIQLLQWLTASTPACAPPPNPYPNPSPSPYPNPSPNPSPRPSPSPSPGPPNVPFGENGLKTLETLSASLDWQFTGGLNGLQIVLDTPSPKALILSHAESPVVFRIVPVNEVQGFVRLKCKLQLTANPASDYPYQTNYFYVPINGVANVPLYFMSGENILEESGYLSVMYYVDNTGWSRVILVKHSSESLIPPASVPGPAVAAARRHRSLY